MRKRILIIDDDPGVRDAYQIIFETAGYEVETGIDCCNYLGKPDGLPDIILLDRQLSGKDGLDICRQLKADEATRMIPIIIMSATFNLNKQVKDAGAEAYLEKPISIHELKKVVGQWANFPA